MKIYMKQLNYRILLHLLTVQQFFVILHLLKFQQMQIKEIMPMVERFENFTVFLNRINRNICKSYRKGEACRKANCRKIAAALDEISGDISNEDREIFYRSLNVISENIEKLQNRIKERNFSEVIDMRQIFEKDYILRASDFDKYNRIKPSAVLELFQDAAGQHAEEIGVGYDAMLARSYFWVLIRVKFRIMSNPAGSQKVILKTWPLEPHRLCYRREFCIENDAGERLIEGSSEWAVLHSEKRRLAADANLYPFTEGYHTEMIFEDKLSKVFDFEESCEARVVNPGFCEIDLNNHVNNTKYANYVMDTVAPKQDDVLEVFQIDYRREVFEGMQLHLFHKRDGNEILVKGVNDSGDIMFACKLEYC